MHFKGYFGAEKNVDRARKLAAAGAALGCSDSKGVLGYLTHEDELDKEVPEENQVGERLIRESAEAGSAWGHWALGQLCLEWAGEDPPDHFRKAAEQEHSDAQFELGEWLYCPLDGSDPNYIEAVRYYRMAAEQGHPHAQLKLGQLYENGSGVAQDFAEAARYYRMACAQGLLDAKRALQRIRLAVDRGHE
jgi:TPR repeat protein